MEVTGLVLSIGEKTTARAIESLKQQTVPCKEIVVIENVTPFYEAMNQGISKIKTPFFIQCDADMIADPDCIETLLSFEREDRGVFIGHLQDSILGKIQAIKLPGSVSCEWENNFSGLQWSLHHGHLEQ